ncbi:hypothetical protein ACFXJ5_14180 [Streptomyces sp. NPDC059373]
MKEIVVVTATGREPTERAELRAELSGLRLAELREGVRLRPANLLRPRPSHVAELAQGFTARPEQPSRALATSVRALDTWAETADAFLTRFAAVEGPADRFATAAAMVRHLLTDPVLPDDRPAPALRTTYTDQRSELTEAGRTGRGNTETRPGA